MFELVGLAVLDELRFVELQLFVLLPEFFAEFLLDVEFLFSDLDDLELLLFDLFSAILKIPPFKRIISADKLEYKRKDIAVFYS
ncbi:MAG: hypothetical protein RR058_02910 [Oscillospiraceae bacterium]